MASAASEARHIFMPLCSASAELAHDVRGADDGHEAEGHHQRRGRANLQAWRIVVVEAQDA